MDTRRLMPVVASPQGNRAQRRKAEQLAKRPHQPVEKFPPPAINNLEIARTHAARLTLHERRTVMRPIRDSFKALREGVATWQQWACVSSAMKVALAIEAQGVVRGMKGFFTAADTALDAFCQRVQDGDKWANATPYFQEIEDIAEAIDFHEDQLRVLAYSEFEAAHQSAVKASLKSGGITLHITEVTTAPIQEKLL